MEEKYVILLSVMRIDCVELLFVENLNYVVMISKYLYLKGVYKEDIDLKKMFFVYVNFGVSDYV